MEKIKIDLEEIEKKIERNYEQSLTWIEWRLNYQILVYFSITDKLPKDLSWIKWCEKQFVNWGRKDV